MKGDNPAFPPKVQDLRGVASYWYESLY
jgi:hypothetical protein